jgi:N-dimethylarginine dimethylaminohydrolase
MAICSHNDWDPLEEIIVGTADHSMLPTMSKAVQAFSYAEYTLEELQVLQGPHDQRIRDEANEDLEILADTLRGLGVKVHRPKSVDHSKEFSSPDWTTTGWYTFCPRDLLLPLDNLVLEAASPGRCRQYESRAYYDYLTQQVEEGVEWISAPKPILLDDLYQVEDLSKPTVNNHEIIWEAPNVVRLGKDLLYQVSNTGTLKGYQWMKNIVEKRGYKLHLAEGFYFFAHFDSTVIPLRPGLVIFNGARLREDHYPQIFKDWDKIWITPEMMYTAPTQLPGGIPPCSPWIGMNMLSVNPNLVIIDKDQDVMRRVLEKHGIESIGLPQRQARTMSGGFHCQTLDVKRKGSLESYFGN